MGELLFYGKENAEARGEHYAYTALHGRARSEERSLRAVSGRERRSFAGLYLEAEAETGYLRDRNVFGEPITIEDTMAVTAALSQRRDAVLLPDRLFALGRAARRHHRDERAGRTGRDRERQPPDWATNKSTGASTGPFKRRAAARLPDVRRSLTKSEIPEGEGGHGGADPVMLEQIFSPDPPPDPYPSRRHRTSTARPRS